MTAAVDDAERLGPTRRRVLAHLQVQGDPMPIDVLASALSLHGNTVRFHLDGLLRDGLVRKLVERRSRQGRPRLLFAATLTVPSVSTVPYRELVDALLTHVRAAGNTEPELAERIGRAWGRTLGAQGEPDDALRGLVEVVNRLGLTSRLHTADGAQALHIVRCPFRELTVGGDATICRIHLGMMRGYLEAAGSDRTVTALQPWVEPELCLATLGPAEASDGAGAPHEPVTTPADRVGPQVD